MKVAWLMCQMCRSNKNLLQFCHTTISMVARESFQKDKTPNVMCRKTENCGHTNWPAVACKEESVKGQKLAKYFRWPRATVEWWVLLLAKCCFHLACWSILELSLSRVSPGRRGWVKLWGAVDHFRGFMASLNFQRKTHWKNQLPYLGQTCCICHLILFWMWQNKKGLKNNTCHHLRTCVEKVTWERRFGKLSNIPINSALDAQMTDAV